MSAEHQGRSAKSVREFCAAYGISAPTFYNEISAGRLKSLKVGRRRIITAEQEAEWCARLEREAQI